MSASFSAITTHTGSGLTGLADRTPRSVSARPGIAGLASCSASEVYLASVRGAVSPRNKGVRIFRIGYDIRSADALQSYSGQMTRLLRASLSSMDFWNNPVDDEVWNES
jgi:hypothetical protein